MASRYPEEVQVPVEQREVRRADDFYRAEAFIRLEVRLFQSDESLSKRLASGQCKYKYTITGRARHTTELAIQLEEMAAKVRK